MPTIVADTLSGIPPQEAQALGLHYIPQIIIFGEESYRDDTEINSQMFIERLRKSSSLPKTAAPPPILYEPVFQDAATRKDSVIVIAPSAELSGTVRSAKVAAQDFPEIDIRVIDTRTIAGSLGEIVKQALSWSKKNYTTDELVAKITEMASREQTYFLVDTLEYLHKGGRIGGAQAFIGSLLQVKPILQISEGRVEPAGSQRTRKKALAYFKDLIYKECPRNQEAHLCVMHGDAYDLASQIAEELSREMGIQSIPIYDLPPAILVHSGPGVIGVGFVKHQ